MRRLTTVALGLLLAAAAAGVRAQELRTYTSSRQLGDQVALDVRVTYGAGRFVVGPAPTGLLYRMNLRYDEELFDPVADFDGKRLHLGVDAQDRHLRVGKQERGELRVELAREVPMELALEFGAGRANMDLGGLSLTDLEVKTGATEASIDVSRPNPTVMERAKLEVGAAEFTARRLGNLNARRIEVNAGVGDITIDLTGDWRLDGRVQINMGLGSLQLRLPEGLGVKLQEKTFLTSVDTQGLVKRGDAYYSLDFDQAQRHVTIDIQAAFGRIDIRWAP
jgi:hypothetical protein